MGNSFTPGIFVFNDCDTELRKRITAAYPPYHIHDADITEVDISNAFLSWQTIMESEDIESYIAAKGSPNFEFTSCLSWFFSVFYEKFFELCPDSRAMFANVSILAQGRLLAGVISSSFDVLKNPERLEKRLIKIVTRHNPMKILATYYGSMGEALLWSLQFTLGSRYTSECDLAWKKIYSFLLNIIVPRAVEYEYRLSLPAGRGRGIGGNSDKSTGSEKSTIRTSMRSIKSTIEERIRNSVSLLRLNEGSSKKMTGTTSNKCPQKILEITETREFESIDYCPFVRKSNKIDTDSTTTASPTSTPEKHILTCPYKKTSLSDVMNLETSSNTPIQVECDYIQFQRTGMINSKDKKNVKTDAQHKNIYKKSLVSIDSSESEDIKVPYFNHTAKYPRQPIDTMATTTTTTNTVTDCNMSDISYEDFKVNKLNRFADKTKFVGVTTSKY